MAGNPQATVAVLLVEDDAMVRGWVRMSLEGTEFRVAGEAASAVEALELVPRRAPDVLLVDYRLPDRLGTEFLRELRLSGDATPTVLMTANAEPGFNELAREAGAQGTSMKTGRSEELLNALRLAAAGGTAFDVRHPRRPAKLAALSPRERDVIRLVAAGATNREIAEQLEVGAETVKTLLARTFTKLGVRKRAEAVAVAHELGIL
ncbi:MAG TPA: response regulator transcription factor [Gaiellaceae bacterium]|nr:response regulator transcription factor [Gaiellaceae bacterium]